DERDAKLVAGQFDLPTIAINLEDTHDAVLEAAHAAMDTLPPSMNPEQVMDDLRARVPLANVKPRLRMTTLYFVANTLNYLVAGTGNASELEIGYFTEYGDGGVDLLPLGKLVKSQVRRLAEELDVPAPVITKAPSAGLWIGQTDEDEMGFTYAELEDFLSRGRAAVPPSIADRI